MVAVKVDAFGGMLPALDDQLLPERAASRSENTWLYSGAIAGINQPTALKTLTSSAISKAYRIPNNYADSQHLADATWLQFQDVDTDVFRTQVVGDTYDRYYWACPSAQPKYNTLARIQASTNELLLGIPAPGVAPSISRAGGSSSTNRTSAYVYTWVSAYGEEGPPSPPTIDTGKIDATWTITMTAPAANDTNGTNRNISKVRIYRTVTAANGTSSYFLVAEQAVGTTTYADTSTDTTVASNNALASTLWAAPPTDLAGWVVMPNGIIAGWRDNEIWFSEPYRPHAWPATYALAVDYPIVGLGVIGQTLVVCTQSYPYAITGVHPSTMSQARLMNLEPCLSRGSIVSTPEGVYYASPNGLVLVANGQARNVTSQLLTKDKWQSVVGTTTLSTLRAARLGAAYYAFGSIRAGVWQTDTFDAIGATYQSQDFTGAYSGVLIDPTNDRVAFNVLSNSIPAVSSFNDPWSGELFIIRNGVLYWINISDSNPTYEVFKWRSKIFQTNFRDNFSVVRIYFDVPATTPTQNPVRNTSSPQTLTSDQYGLLRVYASKTDQDSSLDLVTTRELRKPGEIMRIPSGFKAKYWQYEIEARVRISSFEAAMSVKELRSK